MPWSDYFATPGDPFIWLPPGIGVPPGQPATGSYVPKYPPPEAQRALPITYPFEDPSSRMFWQHHQGPTISPGPPLPAQTGPGDWPPIRAMPLPNVPIQTLLNALQGQF